MIFLKRLELSGFKSFAQKMVLEFPGGVTAIVGPNGSGKSNVVDALRWLLGEREARQLRGEKIENLIFSGTPKRPALGLAQAALCFNNNSHWLPVDFEEVVLTRKVDRSGVSEFFLNHELVRLKDIVELLAKSRLGTRGFTIVNQGESDIFIKNSPLERQQMIEEVIGLKEFQIKKTQSEHRLQTTLINLEKIKAMVEELRPHLRLLKRQTGKWEKRSEIEKELRDLENNYFAFKLAEIRNSSVVLEPGFLTLEKEINQKQKELEKFQKELTKIDELKAQTAELLAKRSDFQRELGHLEAKLEILDDSSPEVEYQAKDLLGLIKEIKSLLESGLAAAELEKLKVILKNLLGKINDFFSVREKAAVKREDFLTVKEEKEKILKKIEALNVELSELAKNERYLIESFKTLEEKREQLNRLENERNKIIFEKEKLNLKLQDLETQLNQIGRKLEDFQSMEVQLPYMEVELPEIEKRMFKLRTNLAGIGDIDSAIVKETQEAEERYQFLSQQSVDLEKASSDLKVLIRDLGRKINSDFQEALKLINKEFDNYFRLMFGGGRAKLKLKTENLKLKTDDLNEEENKDSEETKDITETEAPAEETGIEIDLNLPRRRISSLEMLSGGERSLVSLAALFALISVNPPPFLVLDEIDSALDDRNAQRFAELIKKFSQKTQFIIITHNRATMTVADVLYGITMGEDGVSKVLSLKLDK